MISILRIQTWFYKGIQQKKGITKTAPLHTSASLCKVSVVRRLAFQNVLNTASLVLHNKRMPYFSWACKAQKLLLIKFSKFLRKSHGYLLDQHCPREVSVMIEMFFLYLKMNLNNHMRLYWQQRPRSLSQHPTVRVGFHTEKEHNFHNFAKVGILKLLRVYEKFEKLRHFIIKIIFYKVIKVENFQLFL